VYQPVCGGDGLTYITPGRAGCYVIYDENLVSINNEGRTLGEGVKEYLVKSVLEFQFF